MAADEAAHRHRQAGARQVEGRDRRRDHADRPAPELGDRIQVDAHAEHPERPAQGGDQQAGGDYPPAMEDLSPGRDQEASVSISSILYPSGSSTNAITVLPPLTGPASRVIRPPASRMRSQVAATSGTPIATWP